MSETDERYPWWDGPPTFLPTPLCKCGHRKRDHNDTGSCLQKDSTAPAGWCVCMEYQPEQARRGEHDPQG
jgi:hypothetical protein